MRICYVYDAKLPSKLAAWIQIVNTCHAVARMGVPVEIVAQRIKKRGYEKTLKFYGLKPVENLKLRGGPLEAVPMDPSERTFVISRDECGLDLFSKIGEKARSCRYVYEAHRVCHAYRAERAIWREEETEGRRLRHVARSLLWPVYQWGVARLKRREGRVLRWVDGVVCLTEPLREDLNAAFGLDRPVLVLPSGTSLPEDAPPGERDIEVLYAGKLSRRKGISELIAAMKHLPGRRCAIVGGSAMHVRRMKQVAHAEGVLDRVDFQGRFSPRKIPRFLRRARVGVCPLPAEVNSISERYTSPLKILEYMAHGLPVVASDLPSVRAIVEHEKTGLLYPAGDVAALARAIERLLEDGALAARISRQAREAAVGYSWESRARKLIAFLETIPPDLP